VSKRKIRGGKKHINNGKAGNDSISLKKLLLSTLTTGAGDDSVNIKNILESVIDGIKIKKQNNS